MLQFCSRRTAHGVLESSLDFILGLSVYLVCASGIWSWIWFWILFATASMLLLLCINSLSSLYCCYERSWATSVIPEVFCRHFCNERCTKCVGIAVSVHTRSSGTTSSGVVCHIQLRQGDGAKQVMSVNCLLRDFRYEMLVQSNTFSNTTTLTEVSSVVRKHHCSDLPVMSRF